MAVNVVVACGSGIATSTVVEQRLKDIAEDYNLDINLKKTSMSGLEGILSDADLVVVTSRYSNDDVKVKILSGTSLLTGIGEDTFIDKFVEAVKEVIK